MLGTGIKYAAIAVGCFVGYMKLLNIRLDRIMLLKAALSTAIITAVTLLSRIYAPSFGIILLAVLFEMFALGTFKKTVSLSLTAGLISFALSYFCSNLAILPLSVVFYFIPSVDLTSTLGDAIFCLAVAVVQLLLVLLPFVFKRYRHGMPFLLEHGSENSVAYIGISIFALAAFIGSYETLSPVFLVPLFCIVIFGLFIIFWRKERTDSEYLTRSRLREIETLRMETAQKNDELEALRRDNESLSKIIHKDNKLIPAMEYAVEEFLASGGDSEKGGALAAELKKLAGDRKGILDRYEGSAKQPSATGISAIDAVIRYMSAKAARDGIVFDVSVNCALGDFVGSAIAEAELETAVADLVENAFIATKNSTRKQVLLDISAPDGVLGLSVYDSGQEFSAKTLSLLGTRRITTRRRDGGSGIGLMTLFEIARKAQASVVIDESGGELFTKSVCLVLDGKNEYRVKSPSVKKEKVLSGRRQMVFESVGAKL